ncbi:MAG: hypothetical protein IKY75_05790 [Bacteroidaceae bacterium]|nr:hypothetical protein [Bacteroidaceae bacterium]
MKKIILLIAVLCLGLTGTYAQEQKVAAFEHLDLGITVGTTGIGFDLAAPINEQFRVRAGFSFIPEFDVRMRFGLEGEGGNKFDSMADKFSDFTGLDIDSNIDMVGSPSFYNGNLFVDYFPIKNVGFHVTAGFYCGTSKIASACNAIEDMAALLGVTMYNNIYDKIEAGEPIFDDVYLTPELEDKFLESGRLGIHVGDRVDTGEAYMLEPGTDGTVKLDLWVNTFKPYLGVGYGGKVSKSNDSVRLDFDAGVMFWGGAPKIVTHDGTDLARDVENIDGKIGSYVSFAKGLQVYPVLNLRVSFRLF